MKTQLLAGPWIGEMGWEVATWAPAIRAASRDYSETIVVCKPGHEHLYMDFATICENYTQSGKSDRWLCDGNKAMMPDAISKKYPMAEIRRPRKKKCMSWKREYFKYGHKIDKLKYDLVIHARSATKYGQQKWNWNTVNYEEVIQKLGNIKVCSIGTEAYHIPGTDDRRDISISQLCDILYSSEAFLSPSSGPAHLASLCGCPHIILTDDKYQKSVGGTNKRRYERFWNPFKTKCIVLDKHNWHPPVDVVVEAIKEIWNENNILCESPEMGGAFEFRREQNDTTVGNEIIRDGAQGKDSSTQRPVHVVQAPESETQSKPESGGGDSMLDKRPVPDGEAVPESSKESILDEGIRDMADAESKDIPETPGVQREAPDTLQQPLDGGFTETAEDTERDVLPWS